MILTEYLFCITIELNCFLNPFGFSRILGDKVVETLQKGRLEKLGSSCSGGGLCTVVVLVLIPRSFAHVGH